GIAFTTHSMRADAGIVISASHNPYQDNGIKIFAHDGYKLSFDLENEIEALIASGEIESVRPTADRVGKARRIDDALGRYIVFCKNSLPEDLVFDGLKIVLDCANGATYKVAPIIFSELGADVVPIHCSPDGTNINANCGSQFPADLQATVRECGAHAGFAFDGDGDRLTAVDENGDVLDGDHIMAICARHLQNRGVLLNDLVVITPMSNLGLRQAFDGMGIRYVEAPVGDRNVLECMQERGAALGGEQSGHMIFLEHHTTGDGIISGLQLLAAMRQDGGRWNKLSALAGIMQKAPQRLANVEVTSKPPLEELADVEQAIVAAREALGDKGRVVVRYSGTEHLCRVMVEGPTREDVDRITDGIVDKVRTAIG
ncbi:MAG: phosphoglucosamine mutase, partial [Lentisphaerae bacterium]|nr:phosphoglucosamine mutase [Lentisphaerota bacterium]